MGSSVSAILMLIWWILYKNHNEQALEFVLIAWSRLGACVGNPSLSKTSTRLSYTVSAATDRNMKYTVKSLI